MTLDEIHDGMNLELYYQWNEVICVQWDGTSTMRGCLNELNDDDDSLNLQIETAKMKDEMQLLIVN